jgi:hypothetical protein
MNEPASTILATRDDFSHGLRIDQQTDHATFADLYRQTRALRSELDEMQPVISAAVPAATALRMRDTDGLVSALRILVGATETLEEQRACD